MGRTSRAAAAIMISTAVAAGLAGCTGPPDPVTSGPASPSARASETPSPTRDSSTARPSSPEPSSSPPGSTPPGANPSAKPSRSPEAEEERADPRWRFYTDDRRRYRSPWFDGARRIMIDFGCTDAPYYSPDSRCDGDQGFHHGLDIALPCGTLLRAGAAGRVVDPSRPGTPGAAYGAKAFRIRVETDDGTVDVLIGHARKVLVRPGDRVRPGQPIAETGDLGAPDGCHLHFEQRSVDGGLSTATDPSELLALRRS